MSNIEKFWNNCDKTFAHVSINKYLGNYQSLCNNWDMWFLNYLNNNVVLLQNKTIVDFGIGGAYLGVYLSSKYNIKKYIGIDISDRQLNQSAINLSKNNVNYELHKNLLSFEQLIADVFITQAVIQHFPSIDYLDNFLLNLNLSKIPVLMLQIRHSDRTSCIDGEYKNIKEVKFKCNTNKEYISQKLTNYTNIYSSNIMLESNYQFLFYKTTII